ncbi:MAG: PGF-pre-PGF domain-containing protein [Candidatus Aenigmarchaeota archaeon]|nr:PGF-pre-PGF domain-containing protein [Candidatus Aenigmarchaeota archaeon]
MKNKFFLSLTVFLVLLASVSFASPYFFKGIAHVNGSLAPNGTVIEVFIPSNASTPRSSVTIGEGNLAGLDPGKYVISFDADAGNTLSFRVNGLNMTTGNGTDNTTQTLGADIVSGFNLSINKSANAAACTFANACTGGFCVHSLCRSASTFCGDGFCDSGESTSSCSADCGSSSSSSSSTSGGGGGGGTGPSTTLPSTTTSPVTVTANTPAAVAITETKLPVSEIVLTTNADVTNVQVTVKEVSQPSGASVAISSDVGKVFKYIEITTTAAVAQVSKAKVKFKVDKVWLSSNNIDSSTVALNRLVGTSWTKLPTTKTSEDFAVVYFEAETPGFSTFAITGEKVTAAPACGNNIIESGEECDSQQLSGQTCVTKGFTGGTLKCTSCRFDTSGCTGPGPAPPPGEEKPPEEKPITAVPDITLYAAIAVVILLVYYFFFRKKGKK